MGADKSGGALCPSKDAWWHPSAFPAFTLSHLDVLKNVSRLFDSVSTLFRGTRTITLLFLVLIIFGRSPLPALKSETASGMSFFEKKTERIHRGSPPTARTHTSARHTRSHTHMFNSPTLSNTAHVHNQTPLALARPHTGSRSPAHTNARRGLLGNIRHPGRKEDRLFPHLNSTDTSDVRLKIEPTLTKPGLNPPQGWLLWPAKLWPNVFGHSLPKTHQLFGFEPRISWNFLFLRLKLDLFPLFISRPEWQSSHWLPFF